MLKLKNSMKKILFVIPSLEIGGTISSLSNLIQSVDKNYDITVLSLSHDGISNVSFKDKLLERNFILHAYHCSYKECSGISLIFVSFVKLIKKLCSIINIRLERLLFRFTNVDYDRYDYVVAYQEGSATRYVANLSNQQKIAWVHCDYCRYADYSADLNLYEKFKKIICVSEFTALTFSKTFSTLSDRVKSIYNLLDVDLVKYKSQLPVSDFEKINNTFTIISVGRIDKVKRFEFIPEIAKSLFERECNFKWFIIGPIANLEVYHNLESRIKANDLDNCVIYLGAKPNPYPYFLKSDLLVSLSYTEACPMIFNEAKVLGLPIVSTDFGSAKEFINAGEIGVITPIEGVSDTLYKIMTEDSYYAKLKENISKMEYSNDTIIKSLRDLFI